MCNIISSDKLWICYDSFLQQTIAGPINNELPETTHVNMHQFAPSPYSMLKV